MGVAHYENLFSIVFDELELITGLPVIVFFKNFDSVKLIFLAGDHTSFVLDVMVAISHENIIQAVNLIIVFGFVITNYDITFTIAVYTKVQLAL